MTIQIERSTEITAEEYSETIEQLADDAEEWLANNPEGYAPWNIAMGVVDDHEYYTDDKYYHDVIQLAHHDPSDGRDTTAAMHKTGEVHHVMTLDILLTLQEREVIEGDTDE